MSDKTEEPTPRRLRKAREEGDSGASAQAAQAVAFLVAAALVPSAARALGTRAASDLREAIAAAGAAGGGSSGAAHFDAIAFATGVLSLLVPLLAAVGLAAGVVTVVQTGGVFATKRLALRLDRLDPLAGLRGLFSGARLFAVARAFAAAGVVAWLAWRALVEHALDLARLAGRPRWIAVVVADAAGHLVWVAGLVGLAIGILDLVVTRRTWLGRLKMGKDEVRREHKESEGDPQVKAARERAYHELMAAAVIGTVRTANVVVVNPTHLACALRYDTRGGDDAPVVVASGEGDLAARIAQAAREWGIPVVQDVPLARALIELEVGNAIPEALYEAVAEILRTLADAGG